MTPGTSVNITQRTNLDMIEEPVAQQLHQFPHIALAQYPLAHALGQQLVQILQTSANPTAGLLTLTQALGEIFLADACLICVQDHQRTPIQTTHWQIGSSPVLSHLPAVLQTVLHSPVVQGSPLTSHPVRLAGIRITEEASPVTLLASQTVFQGHANGLVVLVRFGHQHLEAECPSTPWLESDCELLSLLTNQVAIAIAQVQMEHQLQQQVRYQTVMDRLTAAVSSSRDLEQIYKLALEGAVSATQVSRGLVLMLKYANPLHKKRTAQGLPKARAIVESEWIASGTGIEASQEIPVLNQPQIKEEFGISDCAILQELFAEPLQPLVVANLADFQGSNPTMGDSPGIAALFSPDAMPSLLLVPLENQGTTMGGLVLQHSHCRYWQPGEVAFVKLIAAQLSTAIIQNRTLRQVQSLVDERTAQLQRSLDVQAKLYEKTRQQVDQLRRLNQIMEEFLSTMSHELLTPLTSMTLAIRMLREASLSPEQQQRYLDILERQCAQETNLINDLLALQKLESGSAEMHFQPLDIRYPIRDLAQSFEDIWVRKHLTLTLDLPNRPLQVRTDLESLNRILRELLTNAGKYAAPGTTVHLSVSHQLHQHSSQIVVTLANEGAGISEAEMPYIFDKFRRGQGATQQAIPGTGLGLALVKGLVEHLNGEITASSVPITAHTWETCFTLTLPQSLESPI